MKRAAKRRAWRANAARDVYSNATELLQRAGVDTKALSFTRFKMLLTHVTAHGLLSGKHPPLSEIRKAAEDLAAGRAPEPLKAVTDVNMEASFTRPIKVLAPKRSSDPAQADAPLERPPESTPSGATSKGGKSSAQPPPERKAVLTPRVIADEINRAEKLGTAIPKPHPWAKAKQRPWSRDPEPAPESRRGESSRSRSRGADPSEAAPIPKPMGKITRRWGWGWLLPRHRRRARHPEGTQWNPKRPQMRHRSLRSTTGHRPS